MGGFYKKNRKYFVYKCFVEKNKGGGFFLILWIKGENFKKEVVKRVFCMFVYVVYLLIFECK